MVAASTSRCFIGIDVSKDKTNLYVHPTGEQYEFTMQQLEAMVAVVEGHRPHLVVLEATGGYERRVLAVLLEAGVPVCREHPLRIHHHAKAMGHLAKTDRLDAKAIAHYAQCHADRLKPTVLDDEQQQQLKALLVRRMELVKLQTAEKNRLQQAAIPQVQASCQKVLSCLKEELTQLETALEELVDRVKSWSQRRHLLQTAPGVGKNTSVVLLGFLPELGQLGRKQVGALAGVVPMQWQSGRYHGQGRIRAGRKPVRGALYMATLSAVRHDASFGALYQRLVRKGKPKKVALTACMHKLVRVLNAMLASNLPYQATCSP